MTVLATARVSQLFISPPVGQLTAKDKIELIPAYGIKGDRHAGQYLTNIRDKLKFNVPKGQLAFNWREIAITAQNEHAAIAAALDIDLQHVGGEQLFSNIVLDDVPNFSQLPPFTVLRFAGEGRPILFLTFQNSPCAIPANAIKQSAGADDGIVPKFIKLADQIRGMMAIVSTSGIIKVKDVVTIESL